jgi:hypothetical protein
MMRDACAIYDRRACDDAAALQGDNVRLTCIWCRKRIDHLLEECADAEVREAARRERAFATPISY